MGVWSDLESEVSPPVLPSACPGSGLDGGRRSLRSRLCPIPLEAVHCKSVQLLWDPLTLLTGSPA